MQDLRKEDRIMVFAARQTRYRVGQVVVAQRNIRPALWLCASNTSENLEWQIHGPFYQ